MTSRNLLGDVRAQEFGNALAAAAGEIRREGFGKRRNFELKLLREIVKQKLREVIECDAVGAAEAGE